MKPEDHMKAFEELKETLLEWAIKARGADRAQRIIGLTASRAIIELLSIYLHETRRLDIGGSINHRWLSSIKQAERNIPLFPEKERILPKMVELENACTNLAYGGPQRSEDVKLAIKLFQELERAIENMLKK